MFKVGETVRRFKGVNDGKSAGHVATILEIEHLPDDSEGPWLTFTDGTEGYATSFERLPTGPVVTETRIVPGVYDGVEVSITLDKCARIKMSGPFTADELDAAAAVLSALAKGLRDA